MTAEFELVVYEDDDLTPRFAVGTSPAHERPYLKVPTEFAQSEIDLRTGTSAIGQINVDVIDPQTGATQSERFLTALLGSSSGHSALNGRRAMYHQVSPSAVVVMDGVVGGVTLNESFADFKLSIRDIRERGRKVPLFTTGGTSTVFPRGVLNGYGALPGGGWLLPPTVPIVGTFDSRPATGGGIVQLSSSVPTGFHIGNYVLTPAMQAVGEPVWDEEAGALVFPKVEVWWRNVGTSEWHVLQRMESWVEAIGFGMRYTQSLFNAKRAKIKDAGGEELDGYLVRGIWLKPTADEPALPADGASIEVMVVHTGAPSDQYPFHFEGTAGELLRNVYRGDYSDQDPRLRCDESRFVGAAAISALNTSVRLRITKPEPDLREWTEKVYRALRSAPALDSAGRVAPIDSRLPDVDATLVQLDDSNCQPIAGWDHPASDAVTVVRVRYPRDYRIPPEVDPLAIDSAGDGIATVEQPIEARAPDEVIHLIGEKVLEIDGFLFRAIGGSRGEPITGDVANEAGAQVAKEAAAATIDRFAFGGQTGFMRVSTADTAGIWVGDWQVDARHLVAGRSR